MRKSTSYEEVEGGSILYAKIENDDTATHAILYRSPYMGNACMLLHLFMFLSPSTASELSITGHALRMEYELFFMLVRLRPDGY